MKNSSMIIVRLCRLGVCLLPLCLAACVSPGGLADGEPFNLDQVSAERAELTTRVKAALVADERVGAASIEVVLDSGGELPQSEASADNGNGSGSADVDGARKSSMEVLRLEGFVNDETERNAALEIAREASQGLDVIDALQVR